MSQTLAARLDIQFSMDQLNANANIDLNLVDEENSEESLVTHFIETSLYQLYLGKRVLRDELREQINDFRSTYRLERDTYDLFLTRYGTHYVDSVVVGGLITQTTKISAESESQRLLLLAAVAAQFDSVTGAAKEDNVSRLSISVDLELDLQIVREKLEREVSSTSDIFGGDAQFTDFVLTVGEPEATRLLFESWKESLLNNPVGIRYRLVEIWHLFDDPFQRKEMCTALATRLGFLPTERPNYCETAGELLGGTVRGALFGGS